MLRKITRIFLKTLGYTALTLLVLAGILYFAVQSYAFQTWLGGRVTSYLESETGAQMKIDRVKLDFFSGAELEGVRIMDQHKDTLLAGSMYVQIKNFQFRKRVLNIGSIRLQGINAKVIVYKGDSVPNYQFLVDYFASADTTKGGKPWDVRLGDIVLDDCRLAFHSYNDSTHVKGVIDYDDVALSHTSGTISGLWFRSDSVGATVKDLRCIEKSGFKLNRFDAEAMVCNHGITARNFTIRTPGTRLSGQLHFSNQSWDDYSDFVTKVDMNVKLDDSSRVDLTDIGCFTEEMQGLQQRVYLSGDVKGPVSDLHLSNFDLHFGRHTRFKGNLSLNGLPDVRGSFLHFNARQLSTSYADLRTIPAYPFSKGILLSVPAEIAQMGVMNYVGKFDGFLSDFTTYGKFQSSLGMVTTKLSVKIGEKRDDISYTGQLSASHFFLGTLLGTKDLNDLSFNLSLEGKGVELATLDSRVSGVIEGVTFNNYHYHDISVNGKMNDKIFSGIVQSDDPNADFDFNGSIDFSKKIPVMDFIATINRLQLNELNFTNKADSGTFSSQLLINFKGTSLDNISGQLYFDNTVYKTRTRTYKLNSLNIQAEQGSADKKIQITSEYVNAVLRGSYELSHMPHVFDNMLYQYYPSFFKKTHVVKKFNDSLAFKVVIKKFKAIQELLIPDLMIENGTVIEGAMDAVQNKLNVQITSFKIAYGAFKATELLVILNENKKKVVAEASGRKLQFTDSISMENFNVAINSADRDASYSIDWDNLRRPSNKGEIKGSFVNHDDYFGLQVDKVDIQIMDSSWVQEKPDEIRISRNGEIELNPLTILHGRENISVSGKYSQNPQDSLVVSTNHLMLQEFNSLLHYFMIRLEGELNGKVSLTNEKNIFKFNGNMDISSLKVNDNLIGSLYLSARYQTGEKEISLGGYSTLGFKNEQGLPVKNLAFDGTYFLDGRKESLDINFQALPANLRIINPFLEGILTINKGFLRGEGKIHGNPSNIKLDGNFELFNTEIKVDYTNVTYNFDGKVEVMPDQIRFSDINMREKGTLRKQGLVNGNIFHNNFSHMRIDYDITYHDMLVLNTTERENKTYYGHIYSSGNVGLYGFLNNLNMSIKDTVTGQSRFYLPLDGPEEVGESDFIHFVVKDTSRRQKDADLTGFNLDLSVYATPAGVAQIILDKKAGDVLNAKGTGLLNLRINTLGKFEMYGDYVIKEGDYNFTLQNVIRKKFDLESGSVISWSGDPLDANIDVVASYKQRVSVAPLLNESQADDKTRSPVICKLFITGKLFTPNLKFNIDFPNQDANSRASINNVLSDEVEMNRQVFAFLLFKTFITPLVYSANGGGVNTGNAMANTGTDIIGSRVSEFLNNYVGAITGIKDLNIGLNYRPGSLTTSDALDLAYSKQFFNNKVSVDGNIAMNNSQNRSNSGLIGDVNIEYKLTDDGRFKLKGFNRSNDITQSTIAGGPYTQGVGFFYRKEFETIFKRRKKQTGK